MLIQIPQLKDLNATDFSEVQKYAQALAVRYQSELTEYQKSLDVVLTSTSPLFVSQVLGDDPYFRSGDKGVVQGRLDAAKIGAVQIFNKAYWENLHADTVERYYTNGTAKDIAHFFSAHKSYGITYIDFTADHVASYIEKYIVGTQLIERAENVLAELTEVTQKRTMDYFSVSSNTLKIKQFTFMSETLNRFADHTDVLSCIMLASLKDLTATERLKHLKFERKALMTGNFVREDSKIGIFDKNWIFVSDEYKNFLTENYLDIAV